MRMERRGRAWRVRRVGDRLREGRRGKIQLELNERQIVYVRPSRKKVFDENGPRTEELVAV